MKWPTVSAVDERTTVSAPTPHIPSLMIDGLRGIRSLDLPRLGHVTLLAGANGVGKTTVLEAAAAYASRGSGRVLTEIVARREELIPALDDNDKVVALPDFSVLFHRAEGRRVTHAVEIRTHRDDPAALSVVAADRNLAPDEPYFFTDGYSFPLGVRIGVVGHRVQPLPVGHGGVPRAPLQESRHGTEDLPAWLAPIRHCWHGPNLPDQRDLGSLWDSVALTDAEQLAVDALAIVLGAQIERVAVIGDASSPRNAVGRRALVKLRGVAVPVPLRQLGDGAARLFFLALAVGNCRNGILLIDEAENGVHHAIQIPVWRLLFACAAKAHVQIIATTHSWDCVVGFARAACEAAEDGVLCRLEQAGDGLEAVAYSECDLQAAADQRIELR